MSLRTARISTCVFVVGCWPLFWPFSTQARNVAFRQYRTTVAPETGETLQDRCYYQLLLPVADRPVRSVFVIFERGWQLGNLYYDPIMVNFAADHEMGLLLAQHCRSKEREDMDVVPEHGIGRALLTALKQFAPASHHPELAQSALTFFSFSGGGSLVGRMAGFAPDRTPYDSGEYRFVGGQLKRSKIEPWLAFFATVLLVASETEDVVTTAA